MREVAVILLTVAGGLGTFLLGMKHLSEGLQALSGGGAGRSERSPSLTFSTPSTARAAITSTSPKPSPAARRLLCDLTVV